MVLPEQRQGPDPAAFSDQRGITRRLQQIFAKFYNIFRSKFQDISINGAQIKSTWVGWGSLCIAGGGAYYFAKKSINADRAHRHEEAQRRKEEALRREQSTRPPSSALPSSTAMLQNSSSSGGGLAQAARAKSVLEMDDAASPSREAGHDPAATRHEPETPAERVNEKGKYEAAESYTSKKGNRL
ncbi:hypothetical protein AJ78_02545 [Emergomyces pasteurianus Ep9510]|uniref:Uncharacterized protein n=1 Tax=Emergomyces pasteurianus Ep9510 TaxID=1447872 RepID=A0A1J9PLG6_9EURO|nr:hypothetical protein AJ78_02545 [Emergomyces pasteurianus Ep9510]